MARVIFSRRHHPGSVLLRTAMWSPWSHCGIMDADRVIEASAGGGVVDTPLRDFIGHASQWAMVDFPANDNHVLRAARAELGKPYDWQGVAGIGLHRTWNKPDAWFCSELVAYALEKGGLKLFRGDAKRITPMHLWMLNYDLLGVK